MAYITVSALDLFMLITEITHQFFGISTTAFPKANGSELSSNSSILPPTTSSEFFISRQATITMQNNDRRIDPLTKPWDRLPNYDIPGEIDAGWRCGYQGNNHYDSNGLSNYQNRTRDHVVTRPEGYVHYQSVVQPDGRYAYNPHRTQYPRTRNEEYDAGRTALLPAARQYEFMLNRSDNYVHRPGEVVTMGIDYDQMRTAPIRQPQQPTMDQYGRPVVQGPIHGSMGPPPLPHMYGGYYGGQR